MTEQQFLEEHGELILVFVECYKHRMEYNSKDGRFAVYGLAHYRGTFYPEMTVSKLKEELEIFDFEENVNDALGSLKEKNDGDNKNELTDPLSQEEILEGNKLMLDFMLLDSSKSEKWIIECSQFDRSWNELMRVSEKIRTTHGEYSDGINAANFSFKHMMFHEIIGNRSFLYRRCVSFIKTYNEALSKKSN